MAQVAGGRLPGVAQGSAVTFVVVGLAVAVGIAVAVGPKPVHVIAAVLVGLVALLRPAWGLVGYLALAATLPSSEGVSDSEIAAFGLLAWLFVIASLRLLHDPPKHRYARLLITSVYVLFAVILANLAVAWQHGITFRDWARDVAPLANLLMLIVLPAFVRHEKDVRVIRLAFLGVVAFAAVSSALSLSGSIVPGLPRLWNPLMVGGTWVPALLVAAAAAGISEVPRGSRPYLLMGLFGIICAVLTPTRTVWVGVLVTVVVHLLLSLKRGPRHLRRNAVLMLLMAATAGGLLQVWRLAGSEDTWAAQHARFETLSDISEDQSVEIRKEQILEALAQFTRSPIFGTGLGYQYFYRIEFMEKYDEGTNYNHSDLANSLCKMGLIGTGILYVSLVLATVLSGRLKRRALRPQDRWFGGMAQISVIAALVTGNSCPVLQERGTTFILSLLIGLVIAIAANDDTQRALEENRAPTVTCNCDSPSAVAGCCATSTTLRTGS